MIHKTLRLLSFFSFVLLLGCQDILECVINTHPELPEKDLIYGREGHFYSESIRAEINNSPNDDGYFYDFSIYGELPLGLEYYIEHRILYFEGTPLEKGRFRFRVRVYVERDDAYFYDCENRLNDCDGLCDDDYEESYLIEII